LEQHGSLESNISNINIILHLILVPGGLVFAIYAICYHMILDDILLF